MRDPVRILLILALSLMLMPLASVVRAQSSTTTLSGLAMIDYRAKPRFKVGDWVKYHFSSKTEDGRSEDYDLTLLVSGEERFWGDDCFWLETWARGRTLIPQKTAILMSYSIFGDSAWLQHLEVYQRKAAFMSEDKVITQELRRRVLGGRATSDDRPSLTFITDTLGLDTLRVESGVYVCTKVTRKLGIGNVEERGDSTMRTENWERRTIDLTPRVPITSMLRNISERWVTRKTWKAGNSADAVSHDLLRGTGTLSLVGWGSGDLTPELTPENARGTLARKAEIRRSAPKPRKRG